MTRPTLFDLPVEQLTEMIGTLAEDDRSLHTLPERTLLADQLREQGFEELLKDFAQRQVPAAEVADELELAWWQSALEAMISGDEYLAMTSGENLRRAHRVGVSPGRLSPHRIWCPAAERRPGYPLEVCGGGTPRRRSPPAQPAAGRRSERGGVGVGDRFDHPTADADLDHLTAGAGRPVPRWAAE